jgi:hypothetical protein
MECLKQLIRPSQRGPFAATVLALLFASSVLLYFPPSWRYSCDSGTIIHFEVYQRAKGNDPSQFQEPRHTNPFFTFASFSFLAFLSSFLQSPANARPGSVHVEFEYLQ